MLVTPLELVGDLNEATSLVILADKMDETAAAEVWSGALRFAKNIDALAKAGQNQATAGLRVSFAGRKDDQANYVRRMCGLKPSGEGSKMVILDVRLRTFYLPSRNAEKPPTFGSLMAFHEAFERGELEGRELAVAGVEGVP